MTDIVERLRKEGAMAGHYDVPAIQREAANEIERLSKYETTVKRIAWDYIELSPHLVAALRCQS